MSSDLNESDLFAKLEEYTAALQKGDRLRCAELLEQFPQLHEFTDCLDLLDHFGDAVSDEEHQRTVTPSDLARKKKTSGGSSQGSSILQPNQQFGKFLINEEIGRGGMGLVFRARQIDLRRDVAIKVIRSHQLADAEELRRFQVEARAAARLQHQNIVSVHEIGEVDGLHYIAMDYIPGETLSAKLKQGPMPIDEAAAMIATIAEAVDYLHQQSVVHRDLKPSNILINEQGQPFVTDFGLARIFGGDESNQTRTGAILGTPSYMAPEQAAGRTKLLGPKTDIYSLGALLYEMICGCPPFHEDNPLDTLVQVIEGEPLLPRRRRQGIHRRLERIIMKCLEKEPERRYETAAELSDDLNRYLRGETVSAASPHWSERLRRWTRRFPAAASRLAGVFAAATIFEIRHLLAGVDDVSHHIEVMSILGIWAVVIALFQFLTRNPRVARVLEHFWCLTDVLFMTTLLLNAQETGDLLGPLVVGYPMIVVSSGMFFNVRVVVGSTLFSLLGYLVIWIWHPREPEVPLYGFIFLAVLGILGLVTAHQVHRAKVLSRYYDTRG